LTQEEWEEMLDKHSFFDRLKKYAEASFVMSAENRDMGKEWTVESEGYFLSGGNNSPM